MRKARHVLASDVRTKKAGKHDDDVDTISN